MHTQDPWEHVATNGGWDAVADVDSRIICNLGLNEPDNATRIVACVNAMAGIPNPAAVAEVIAALKEVAEYVGEGPPTTPWRDIVRDLGERARIALAKLDEKGT